MTDFPINTGIRAPIVPPNLPIYPHLGMTEQELLQICEALWTQDKTLARFEEHIAHQIEQRAIEETRLKEFDVTIRAQYDKLDELRAELKKQEIMLKETHGLIAGAKWRIKMTEHRENEAQKAILKRKRWLYLDEAQKRLRALGKEIKLGKGRRAEKGLGTAVEDVKEGAKS